MSAQAEGSTERSDGEGGGGREDAVAELIDRITIAKQGSLSPEREAAWAEVAARRSAEIDSGKEKLIPGHGVSARIRRIVGR